MISAQEFKSVMPDSTVIGIGDPDPKLPEGEIPWEPCNVLNRFETEKGTVVCLESVRRGKQYLIRYHEGLLLDNETGNPVDFLNHPSTHIHGPGAMMSCSDPRCDVNVGQIGDGLVRSVALAILVALAIWILWQKQTPLLYQWLLVSAITVVVLGAKLLEWRVSRRVPPNT